MEVPALLDPAQHRRAWASLGIAGMPHGSLTLAEYPAAMVRLKCEKCGRSGQYRKTKNEP